MEDQYQFDFLSASDLPYVDRIPDDRTIVIMPFYSPEESQFRAYTQVEEDKIIEMEAIDLASGTYISKEPADEARDHRLPFTEIVFHYFSVPDIFRTLNDIEQDLLNGLASIHKYFVLLQRANKVEDFPTSRVMGTEIEYVFGNYRSFYDLIQKIIIKINNRYHPNPQDLKDSFTSIVQEEPEYIAENLSIPVPLVYFYKRREKFFLLMRKIRDNIFHHGHSPETIFTFEDGFAIDVSGYFASDLENLEIWTDQKIRNDSLGSVIALFGVMVQDMFHAMNELGGELLECFEEPPPALAEGYHVYVRSELSHHLVNLDRYYDEHWLDPETVLINAT